MLFYVAYLCFLFYITYFIFIYIAYLQGSQIKFCSWTIWTKSLVYVFMNGSWTSSQKSRSFFYFMNMLMNQSPVHELVHEHVQIWGGNLNKTYEQVEFEQVHEQFMNSSWTHWIWTVQESSRLVTCSRIVQVQFIPVWRSVSIWVPPKNDVG